MSNTQGAEGSKGYSWHSAWPHLRYPLQGILPHDHSRRIDRVRLTNDLWRRAALQLAWQLKFSHPARWMCRLRGYQQP